MYNAKCVCHYIRWMMHVSYIQFSSMDDSYNSLATQLYIFMQGRLCLSARLIGFHSELFGHKTKFLFLWEDIETIQVFPPTFSLMVSPIIVMTLRLGRVLMQNMEQKLMTLKADWNSIFNLSCLLMWHTGKEFTPGVQEHYHHKLWCFLDILILLLVYFIFHNIRWRWILIPLPSLKLPSPFPVNLKKPYWGSHSRENEAQAYI